MKKAMLITICVMLGGVAHGAMPTMNATDPVYGYHLRDVYKDMEGMKYDDTNIKNSISDLNTKIDTEIKHELNNKLDYINSRSDLLADSVTNITNNIANTSDRIDRMENTINNSVTNINNDMGVIKNDMVDTKHRVDSLESSTNKLYDNINSLHNDVSNINNTLEHLKNDTHKGLAQANALSSLKYLGGKGLQISIGTGGYRGTSAIAYGLFYGINDDLMIYAGGTDNSYNASINIRVGGK